MAITIPILTDFDGRGIDRGIKQFQKLETTGQKAGFLIRKAAVPAAAAIAALGAGAIVAAKAAAEDAAASDKLANTLRRVAGASDAAVAANERFISRLSQSVGVADDELRPAFGRLATATGDLGKAQQLLGVSLDVAAQTGKPLESVTVALSKAYSGSFGALNKLLPGFDQGIIKSKDFAAATAELARLTGGAAAENAATASGQFQRFRITLEETKESIGAALLPIFERFLPMLQRAAQFVQNNTGAVVTFAAVLGGLAGAVLAVNGALKVYEATLIVAKTAQILFNIALTANPIGIVVTAIGLLVAGLVVAYQKSETFRNVVNRVFEALKPIGEAITAVLVPALQVFKKYVELLLVPLRALKSVVEGTIGFITSLGGAIKNVGPGASQMLADLAKKSNETSAAVRRLSADFGTMGNKVAIAVRSARGNLASLASNLGGLAGRRASAGSSAEAERLEKEFNAAQDVRREGELRAAVGSAETEKERVDAQTALDDFLTQKKIKNLRDLATEQSSSAQKSTEDLAASFNLGLINATQFKEGLAAIIGPGYGEELGTSFTASFQASIAETLAQLQELTGRRGQGLVTNAPLPTGIREAGKKPKKPKPKKMATGGLVMSPTFALIGEAGPEAVIPLNRANGIGGITINIEAGLVSTPDQVGQQIIEAIQRAQRRSGPAFAPA